MAIGLTLRRVCTLFEVGTMGALTDAQLLGRFANRNDEAAELAFTTIVERHGPMVIRVCRGVLDDPDAQDAFQATFLVLVTRMHSVRSRESLGSWLHGVALRVSRSARASAVRRQIHERRRAEFSETVTLDRDPDDVGPVVRDEFARLPERYRAPIALCDIDDLTHEEAARRLGWPVGTVKSRLSRGRATLRERLVRRGLGAAPILLPRSPALLSSLIDQTARTAMKVAANGTAAGMVPAAVEALLQGVRRMMVRDMMRNGVVAALAFGLIAAGVAISADAPVDRQIKPASIPAERQFTTKVRFLEMKGIDWKDAVGAKLKPVKTRPGLKVWTTEGDVIGDLRKLMKSEVQAPRVTSFEGSTATIENSMTHYYIADARWEPRTQRGGFRYMRGDLFDGVKVHISGRKIDQGMLVRVNVDDRRLLGIKARVVHSPVDERGFTEVIPFSTTGPQGPKRIVEDCLSGRQGPESRVEDLPKPVKAGGATGLIQIPQTTTLQQEGEWLIPDGGMLVLSTGSYHAEPPRVTTNLQPVDALLDELGVTDWLADRNYWSSSVVERLVVIDARSFEEPVKVSRAASGR